MTTATDLEQLRTTLAGAVAPAPPSSASTVDALMQTVAAQALLIRSMGQQLRQSEAALDQIEQALATTNMSQIAAALGQAVPAPVRIEDVQAAAADLASALTQAKQATSTLAVLAAIARIVSVFAAAA